MTRVGWARRREEVAALRKALQHIADIARTVLDAAKARR